MAKRQKLQEFLEGKASAKDTLVEYNFMSPGSLADLVNVNRTSRTERMEQAWRDIMISLEALWLDVIDVDPDIYDAATQTLQEIRRTPPEACRSIIGPFEQLKNLLMQNSKGDQEIELFASRMNQLQDELNYICDTFDPEKDPIPGAPVKSKRDWKKAQQADQADITYAAPGAEAPDSEGPEQEEPAEEEPDQDDVPGREQEPDQEAPEDAEEAPEDQDIPGREQDQAAVDKFHTDLKNQLGQGEEPEEETPEGQPEQPQWSQDFKQDMQQVKPQPKKPAVQQPPEEQPQEEDPEEEEPDQEGAKKRPFPPKKGVKESEEGNLPPATASLVLASFQKAADSISESRNDLESSFLEAAETLKAAMEQYSDVSSVYVDLGALCPGHYPRVDLFCEWEAAGKVTGSYGYARLMMTEGGLEVRDYNDAIKSIIPVEEETRDQDVVNTVYESLSTVRDGNLKRVLGRGQVVEALYNLFTLKENGFSVPEYRYVQILAGLRPRIGLHEAVRMVPQEISIRLDESAHGLFSYFYDWAVRTPLTYNKLPDEIGFDTVDDPVPQDLYGWGDDPEDLIDQYAALEVLTKATSEELLDLAKDIGLADDDETIDTMNRQQVIQDILNIWDAYEDDDEEFEESITEKNAPPGLPKGQYYAWLGKTPWGAKPKKKSKDAIGKWNRSSKFKRLFMKHPSTGGEEKGKKKKGPGFWTKRRSVGGLLKGAAKLAAKGAKGLAKHVAQTAKGAVTGKYETHFNAGDVVEVAGKTYTFWRYSDISENIVPPMAGPSYAILKDADGHSVHVPVESIGEGRKTGAYSEMWRTPTLVIDLKEKKIYLVSEGKKEEVPPDTKDEDISARLASMAYQKEDVHEGCIIEGGFAEINRRDTMKLIETPMGVALQYDPEELEMMTTEELWDLAVEHGYKVHGDGVTWDREKLILALSGHTVL